MNGLREELARVGIRGRLARRIELELADHVRCDPSAELGSPALIADRFAAELRLPRTRRATYSGFGALALTAVLLMLPQRGMSAAGGFPDLGGVRGDVASLGGLAIALGAQVAFVAGLLALWRFWISPQELRLAQRRTGVALGAGLVVVAGEVTQAAALAPALPAWWLALALVAAATPALALGGAAQRVRVAAAITPDARTTRSFPSALVVAVGAAAVLCMGVGSTIVEHTWIEGAWRGMIELVAFTVCFLVLGRRLGIRR